MESYNMVNRFRLWVLLLVPAAVTLKGILTFIQSQHDDTINTKKKIFGYIKAGIACYGVYELLNYAYKIYMG